MSIRLLELRTYDRNGEIDQFNLASPTTVLVGPRNSSKTTTLRMIDYCMGSDESAAALRPDVSEHYLGIELDVRFGEQVHVIRRSFEPSFGQLTRVQVDSAPITPREFSDWALERLGWPSLQIPKGRVAQLATELVPLSFRTLWRHIYRREGSWLEFASQEQEFHRRAVLSLFLGLAESRYSNAEFHAAAAMRRVEELQQQLVSIQAVGDETVRQVAAELALPETSAHLLTERDAQLAQEINDANASREQITASARATAGYSSLHSADFQDNVAAINSLRDQVRTLEEVLAGYRTVLALGDAEVGRLSRAQNAVEQLSAMPVTLCPVCGQATPHPVEFSAETGCCYLCEQPVVTDARGRRIELERAIIGRESAEIHEAIERTDHELAEAKVELARLLNRQEELARLLDEERQALLAPFVAELEDLSRRIGGLEQKRAALSGLRGLIARQAVIERDIEKALQDADRADAIARAVETSRTETHRRCGVFARRMSEFLNSIKSEPWRFGEVALAGEELSFYVGAGPWDIVLGGESKVLFLLSYHYALLHLAVDLPDVACSPGLAILDNPLQHGLRDPVVAECLDMLAAAAKKHEGQVITTLAHRLPMNQPVEVRPLTVQYSPDHQQEGPAAY